MLQSGVHLVFEKIESGSNIPKLDNVYVTMDSSQIAVSPYMLANLIAYTLTSAIASLLQKVPYMKS